MFNKTVHTITTKLLALIIFNSCLKIKIFVSKFNDKKYNEKNKSKIIYIDFLNTLY